MLAAGAGRGEEGVGAREQGDAAGEHRSCPDPIRHLAGIQSMGDFVASAVIGIVWTIAGPSPAFGLAVVAMLASLVSMVTVQTTRVSEADG